MENEVNPKKRTKRFYFRLKKKDQKEAKNVKDKMVRNTETK